MVTSRLGWGRGLLQRRTLRGFAQTAGQNFIRLLHQFADMSQVCLDFLIAPGKDRGEMVDNRFDAR